MKRVLLAALVAVLALIGASTASAATTVIPADANRLAENTPPPAGAGWIIFTRAGTPATAASFGDVPAGAPLGDGSLQLSTVTGAEKVFAYNFGHVGTKLSDIDAIAYSTYRTAGTGQQVAALNAVIDFNGPAVDGGFSTLVFEPVYNTGQGAVVSGAWQTWTATGTGNWWSTRAINGQCAGATALCDKTWAEIVASNPDATILGGVGVNQGSGNTGLISSVDAFTFDATTYDFEADNDNDGVGNGNDNCVDDANGNQADADGDGIGNVCEADTDGDGVIDDDDNCVDDDNTDQADADGDGIGTACDEEELPSSAADCKKGRFTMWTRSFKNQGDCVSFVEAMTPEA